MTFRLTTVIICNLLTLMKCIQINLSELKINHNKPQPARNLNTKAKAKANKKCSNCAKHLAYNSTVNANTSIKDRQKRRRSNTKGEKILDNVP